MGSEGVGPVGTVAERDRARRVGCGVPAPPPERAAESERDTDAAFDAAETLHATAAEGSDAVRRHRLHEPALSGRSEPMVLNGAYLVELGRVDAWRAAIEDASARSGLAVEVTGPWVPYSFVDQDAR